MELERAARKERTKLDLRGKETETLIKHEKNKLKRIH